MMFAANSGSMRSSLSISRWLTSRSSNTLSRRPRIFQPGCLDASMLPKWALRRMQPRRCRRAASICPGRRLIGMLCPPCESRNMRSTDTRAKVWKWRQAVPQPGAPAQHAREILSRCPPLRAARDKEIRRDGRDECVNRPPAEYARHDSTSHRPSPWPASARSCHGVCAERCSIGRGPARASG